MNAVKILCAAALIALCACGRGQPAADSETTTPRNGYEVDAEAELQNMRMAAMELGATLKQRLVTAMGEGGPQGAISVCAQEAPAIAAEISARTGLDVGRTSLRVRNAANAPDEWEVAQLDFLAAKLAAGEDAAAMEAWAIISEDGVKKVRWMKPLITEELCLACHGASVSPDVQAAISGRYPGDAATGFQLGDLRGAFTVVKSLSDVGARSGE
jgi:hypothetical protein